MKKLLLILLTTYSLLGQGQDIRRGGGSGGSAPAGTVIASPALTVGIIPAAGAGGTNLVNTLVDATHLNYIQNVTSDVQTQINGNKSNWSAVGTTNSFLPGIGTLYNLNVTTTNASLTANTPNNFIQTWNNAGVTFGLLNITITNTAEAAASSAIQVINGASTVFKLKYDGSFISIGGTSSSFPGIKRNGAGLDVRLADDSGYAALACGALTASGDLITGAGKIKDYGSGQLGLGGAGGSFLYVTSTTIALCGNVLGFRTSIGGADDTGLKRASAGVIQVTDGSTGLGKIVSAGFTDASSAAAGTLGEVVSSLVAVGSPVSLTTSTAANVTSISLTAGDWDVTGNVNFSASTATVTGTSGGITVTTATVPTDGSEVYSGVQLTLLSGTDSVTVPRKRINVSSTTTVYLVGKCTFSAGTVGAFGSISARRIR